MTLLLIVKHEWRVLVADKATWLLLALYAGAIAYGVYNGTAWVRFQQKAINEGAQLAEEQLNRFRSEAAAFESAGMTGATAPQGARPWVVGGFGQFIAMPPAPLAVTAIGQSDINPYYGTISIFQVERYATMNNVYESVYEIENPTNLMAGRFDLSFVIIYLYPLIILALSYNLISAEREQGTLSLALAQPVTLAKLVFGKVVLRASVVLLTTVGVSLLCVLSSGTDLWIGDAISRFALWVAAVVAYGMFWFGVAVLVNASGKASATNAVSLAGLWLALVVIIPALLNVVLTMLYPVPSRMELVTARRAASDEAESQGGDLVVRYYRDHPELIPEGGVQNLRDWATNRHAARVEADRHVQPLVERFKEQLTRQQTLVSRFRFISPAIATQEALNDIAGTGTARYKWFRALADRFDAEWQSFFITREFRKVKLTYGDYDRFPVFTFREEPRGSFLSRIFVGLIKVIIPAAILWLLGVRLLRSYGVIG